MLSLFSSPPSAGPANSTTTEDALELELPRPGHGRSVPGARLRSWAMTMAVRARSDRRRLAISSVVACTAAVATHGVLISAPLGESGSSAGEMSATAGPAERSTGGTADGLDGSTEPSGGYAGDRGDRPASASDSITVDDGYRTLAIERTRSMVPLEIGQRVEVVAVIPTPMAVEVTVLAESARVVAIDEAAIVLQLTPDQARDAVEVIATGHLELLGRG